VIELPDKLHNSPQLKTLDHGSIDAREFRAACSRFPTGVTVLTVTGGDGGPHGITISSFTSVSLKPPMVLACIDHRSRVLEHLALNVPFGLSVLSEQQREISMQFSGAWCDRFRDVRWYPGSTGVPLLFDVSALFECKAGKMVDAGDHVIVVGHVRRVASFERRPLVYVNSSYSALL